MVKRNNTKTHSIIDYILTTESMKRQIRDNIVDEDGLYRIKGRTNFDHSTMITRIGRDVKKIYNNNKTMEHQ